MLSQHRPSILQRPVLTESRNHNENAPIEYQRYQERLAALQARASRREQELLNRLYPPAPDSFVHHNAKQYQGDEDSATRQVPPQTAHEVETRFRRRSAISGDRMEHPWNYSTTHDASAEAREWVIFAYRPYDANRGRPQARLKITSIEFETLPRCILDGVMEEAAARAAARQTMKENQQIMEAKRQAQALEKSRDRNIAVTAVKTEESWWNRGAASEKWIPPEHRVRGKGAKAQANNSQGAAGAIQWSGPSGQPYTTHPKATSIGSAAPWAPYATTDNVPRPRQVSYRPTAPFSTSEDGPKSVTAPVSRRHNVAASVRAPFASHDEISTECPVTPPGHTASAGGGARRQHSHSSLPPFDNDNQPSALPPRPSIRMATRARDTCPYDTAPDKGPQGRTAPMANTNGESSRQQISSGHQENRPSCSNTPTAAHSGTLASHQAPWRTTELSRTAAEGIGCKATYIGDEVNCAMHGFTASQAPSQTNKEGRAQLPHSTQPEAAGREQVYAGEHVHNAMHRHPGELYHTNARGEFFMPSYTSEENAGRDHLLGGQDVDRVMHRVPGETVVSNARGMLDPMTYTQQEVEGRDHVLGGHDVDQLMHRRPGETVVSNARGTLDPMTYTQQEVEGRDHVLGGHDVDRLMHRKRGETVVSNARGMLDPMTYTDAESEGREHMYAGERVDRVMHPSAKPVATNASGTFDMPQYTSQEDAAREAMYAGDRVDRVMHPTGKFVSTNARGTFVPSTVTKQEVGGRQHMYDSSGVNAAMHMSPEPYVVNKEGVDKMPQYTRNANSTRRAFYAGDGVGDALHADAGYRTTMAISASGRTDLPQGTGYEEKGRKETFYEDTVNSILHPVAEGRRRLSSVGDGHSAGLSDVAGFSVPGGIQQHR